MEYQLSFSLLDDVDDVTFVDLGNDAAVGVGRHSDVDAVCGDGAWARGDRLIGRSAVGLLSLLLRSALGRTIADEVVGTFVTWRYVPSTMPTDGQLAWIFWPLSPMMPTCFERQIRSPGWAP